MSFTFGDKSKGFPRGFSGLLSLGSRSLLGSVRQREVASLPFSLCPENIRPGFS